MEVVGIQNVLLPHNPKPYSSLTSAHVEVAWAEEGFQVSTKDGIWLRSDVFTAACSVRVDGRAGGRGGMVCCIQFGVSAWTDGDCDVGAVADALHSSTSMLTSVLRSKWGTLRAIDAGT
jgi:hypothetical protein